MKDIPCKIPSSNEFPDKLYIYHHGKVASFMFITIVSWFLILVHYLVSVNQWWSFAVIAFFMIYCLVPINWYLKTIYKYFISSIVGIFFSLISTYYISSQFINASNYQLSDKKVFSIIILLSICIFIIELYQERRKIDIYKDYIKSSIIKFEKKPNFL